MSATSPTPIELFYHAEQRRGSTASRTAALFEGWAREARQLGAMRPRSLQPIWSLPRVEDRQFSDAQEQAQNRLARDRAEIGFDVSALKAATGSATTHIQRMSHHEPGFSADNIFKPMKDMKFEETISHQCGVTMNDSVEARAIAEVMAKKPGIMVTYHAGDDPHRRRRARSSSRWMRSARRSGAR